MKKILVSITAIALLALMSSSVVAAGVHLPAPDFTVWGPNTETHKVGLTPGFWKHNLSVYLGESKGAYSDTQINTGIFGSRINEGWMDWILSEIAVRSGVSLSPEQLLADLSAKGPGSEAIRTNTANWFNYVNGFLPFQ